MGHTARRLIVLLTCVLFVFGLYACKGKDERAGMPEGPTGMDLTPGFKQHADMLESALKDDPNNSGILIQLGNLYYDWGQSDLDNKAQTADPTMKWTRAVDFYKRALAVNPKDVNVRVDMANLIRYLGNPDEAIKEYRTAISQDPTHPQARINLIATLGEDKKDYKGALSEYEALVKAVPDQKFNTALREQVDNFKSQMKEARK